jgi:hypothetical protein
MLIFRDGGSNLQEKLEHRPRLCLLWRQRSGQTTLRLAVASYGTADHDHDSQQLKRDTPGRSDGGVSRNSGGGGCGNGTGGNDRGCRG